MKPTTLSTRLLKWYDANARVLPWRAQVGAPLADPYRVWLSEIMLQQTTVAAVIPHFERYTALYPTVVALAAAPVDEVLRLWAGLGYYARARNLHACARVVVAEHGGQFPADEAALLKLPGIGAYTAAAIASIAHGQRAVVVDGNVERVMARLFQIELPMPAAKSLVRKYADSLTPDRRAGDYAQAVMDLGATICTPKRPKCQLCPWSATCLARLSDNPEVYPRKALKSARPTRCGLAFWLEAEGHVWLRRRPPLGLLGGMVEVPSTVWMTDYDFDAALVQAPMRARWQRLPGHTVHVFTHFRLELDVVRANLPKLTPLTDGFWQPLDQIRAAGLPTALRKVAELVMLKTHDDSMHI